MPESSRTHCIQQNKSARTVFAESMVITGISILKSLRWQKESMMIIRRPHAKMLRWLLTQRKIQETPTIVGHLLAGSERANWQTDRRSREQNWGRCLLSPAIGRIQTWMMKRGEKIAGG
jgi:hypothetical protein